MVVRYFRARRAHVLAGLLLLAASLLFHSPALLAGSIAVQDDLRVFYFPLLVATAEALGSGSLVLWTPNIFGGYPLFADGEAGMLYPLHLLLLPRLAPESSLVALYVSHSFLAGIFTYALLRTLRVGFWGGIVGGLTYAYSGFAAGQIVHTNVFEGLVWLPLALAFAEQACRTVGPIRYRYAVLAGAVVGVQALAVHIHVTLMTALAVSAFLTYRGILGLAPNTDSGGGDGPLRSHVRSFASAGSILVVIGALGMGFSAVQLIPLAELGLQTYRASGLTPDLARVNSIWPGGLLTLVLPRLHDTPTGGFWGPWVKWETVLYVGVLPLILAAIGLCARTPSNAEPRRLHGPFFGCLVGVSLLLTLGPHAPVPLWETLHGLPGFDVLRSPGRFALLFALAAAVLAGFGTDWLCERRRPVPWGAAAALVAGTATVTGAAVTLGWASEELRKPGSEHVSSLLEAYRQLPGVPKAVDGAPLTAERVGELAAAALALTNPLTAWQVSLMLASVLLISVWLLAGTIRRSALVLRSVAAGAAVFLVFVDLWVVGVTFHPYAPLAELHPKVPEVLLDRTGPPFRVYTPPTVEEKLTQVEPNRLLAAGIQEAGGYSSLQSDRHAAYVRAVEYADNHLLDLWNARYVVRRNQLRLLPSYGGTSFHPQRPLLSGKQGTPGANGSFIPEGGEVQVDEVRIVAALWDARLLADGSEVARIELEAPDGSRRSLKLRAGHHVSDAAIDMPPWGSGVRDWGLGDGSQSRIPNPQSPVSHARAEVAFQYQRTDRAGDRFGEQLSYSRHRIDPPLKVSRIHVEQRAQVGGFELFGLGLWNAASGEVTQVRDKAKYRIVHADSEIRIFENSAAMPRAFMVTHGVAAPPGRDVLSWMLDGPFDPRTTVILEGSGDLASGTSSRAEDTRGPNQSTPGSATVASYKNERVMVRTSTASQGFLVLTDPFYPGWTAWVDGERAPIQRADYLFRAIAVPAGQHVVEFLYQPGSVALGACISLLAAWVIVLASLLPAWGAVRARLPFPRRPGSDQLLPHPARSPVPDSPRS